MGTSSGEPLYLKRPMRTAATMARYVPVKAGGCAKDVCSSGGGTGGLAAARTDASDTAGGAPALPATASALLVSSSAPSACDVGHTSRQ